MILVIFIALTVAQLKISSANKVYYVLPDNTTNTSCPSQPCRVLSQYLSDNTTWSFVSDVEFYFLPGVHQVTSNMVVWHVHNFLVTGFFNSNSPPTLLCHSDVLIIVLYSHNVSISNIILKNCGGSTVPITSRYIKSNNDDYDTASLFLFANFHCTIRKITILHKAHHGIRGINVLGESQIDHTTVILQEDHQHCSTGISLAFMNSILQVKYNNTLLINSIVVNYSITTNFFCHTGLDVSLTQGHYSMNIILTSSNFESMILGVTPAIDLEISSSDSTNAAGADPGGGTGGTCPPPPSLKKMYIRSRYSNRAVNHQSL